MTEEGQPVRMSKKEDGLEGAGGDGKVRSVSSIVLEDPMFLLVH